jgi:universal stress protein A
VYNNILVAIDLSKGPAQRVVAAAHEFAVKSSSANTNLSVVHVVEPQYIQYSFDPTFTGSLTQSLENDALQGAGNRVAELCQPFGIAPDHQHVLLGRTADQIQELAKANNTDLIVIGSHGQNGWRALLGSTANAVLHGAPMDVMVIRIPKNDG